jgi:hypothetical protein
MEIYGEVFFCRRQNEEQSTSATHGSQSSDNLEERQGESSACVTSLYSHLTTLRNLRDGFIEQHGSEPSVSLRYSQQSTANATISLRVGDELSRGSFDASRNDDSSVPSTSQSERTPIKGSSLLPEDGTVIIKIWNKTTTLNFFGCRIRTLSLMIMMMNLLLNHHLKRLILQMRMKRK